MRKVEQRLINDADHRPLVSATMATWNGEQSIRASIDSALAQSYPFVELIVVDDGSVDGTAEICRSYGDKIRYIRQPKDDSAGGTAIIRGYREAKGKYIACLDHDDLWEPEKIALQVAALTAQPDAGAAFTRFSIIDEEGNDRGVSSQVGASGDVFHRLLEGNMFCYSSGMFLKEALDRVGFHDLTAGIGDWDHWLRIARAYPVIMLDQVLTSYRVHAGGYSVRRARMIEASERVLANQSVRLHPDCDGCRISLARGHDHLASDWMAHALASLENGERRIAADAIGRAWRLSPRSTLYWLRTRPMPLLKAWFAKPAA